MIHHLQGHEVVESLTTIATPHRGSSLAKRFTPILFSFSFLYYLLFIIYF